MDYGIEYASLRVKRVGGDLRINSSLKRHTPSLTVHADAREDDSGVGLHVRTDCGGIEEGLCMTALTPEQARDVAQRLQMAAEHYENGEAYHER